jgi:hypothetical protein
MIEKQNVVWVCLLVCLIGCDRQEGVSVGQIDYEVEKAYDDAVVDFVVRISKASISISDSLYVQLEAVADEGVDVTLPSLGSALGEYEFSLLDSERDGAKLLDDGRVVRRSRYHLEPVLAGKRMLPGFEVAYVLDGVSGAVVVDPIVVEVTSPFAEGVDEGTEPADIKPLVEVRFERHYLWLWIGLVVLALLVLTIFVVRRYRRKDQEVVRRYKSAHRLAFERMDELEKRKLLTQGLFKPFYEEISSILRWYIEDRFEVKAPEQTTEEFLREAQDSSVLNEAHTEKLQRVLEHCDQVKFARYKPEAEEVERSVGLVKEFIEATVDEAFLVDVTDRDGVRV